MQENRHRFSWFWRFLKSGLVLQKRTWPNSSPSFFSSCHAFFLVNSISRFQKINNILSNITYFWPNLWKINICHHIRYLQTSVTYSHPLKKKKNIDFLDMVPFSARNLNFFGYDFVTVQRTVFTSTK